MSWRETIEAQQKGLENTAAWLVGEQLKDICASDPECAAQVEADLSQENMSIIFAEESVRAIADAKHAKHKGRSAFVTPAEAEAAIRKFYGLPESASKPTASEPPAAAAAEIIDLADYL